MACRFVQAYNSLSEDQSLLRDILQAYIVVIPKEGKDPEACSSYLPISLLNTNLKIFTKILALRIIQYIPTLIHPDQVGFTSGREGRDNIQKVLNAIHYSTCQSLPLVLLSADV